MRRRRWRSAKVRCSTKAVRWSRRRAAPSSTCRACRRAGARSTARTHRTDVFRRTPMDPTHEVFNQAAPLVDRNLYTGHLALQDALRFNAPSLERDELEALGARVGSQEMQTHARLANVHGPRLL